MKIGIGANRAAASFLHKHGFIYPLAIACFRKPISKTVVSDKIGVHKFWMVVAGGGWWRQAVDGGCLD